MGKSKVYHTRRITCLTWTHRKWGRDWKDAAATKSVLMRRWVRIHVYNILLSSPVKIYMMKPPEICSFTTDM